MIKTAVTPQSKAKSITHPKVGCDEKSSKKGAMKKRKY
jgi:hypothetical protein